MEYRSPGHSGLRVSQLTLGAMTFGLGKGVWESVAGVDREGAMQLVRMALDSGINLIDTADVYSQGQSEDIVEVMPVARLHGTALMVWSPLAGGYLSGKYTPDGSGNAPARGRRTSLDFPPVDPARIDPIVHALRDIARTLDATPAQVALAWLLGRPNVATVIVGARSAEQLATNLRAADVRLASADRERLDELSRPAVPYPHWMQHFHDRDRA